MFQTLTDVAVEVGKNFFGVFEHGDRAAETTEDGGEFEPDDSGSNDTQFLGAQRNQYPRAMRLPKDFFSYYSFGLPTHFVSIVQRPNGFQIDKDCRRLMEWKPNGSMRIHPFELIQKESGLHVRYRNDWHIGAMPERYTYDETGQKQPLNELALDLAPGEYGRAVCNGRFRDWDTGIWYYVLDILNVMPLAEPTDSLTSFMDREPSKIYTKIDRLW